MPRPESAAQGEMAPGNTTEEDEGRRRVVIEAVKPEVAEGRYPAKRTIGDRIAVEADIFADGAEVLSCVLLHHGEDETEWTETRMVHIGNDRWRGEFPAQKLGRYRFTLRAWVDRFETWRDNLERKVEAGFDVGLELLAGSGLVKQASIRASGSGSKRLAAWANVLAERDDLAEAIDVALGPELREAMARYPDRRHGFAYNKELAVVVERERARFGSWYEMFPRSCSASASRHGTFRDAEARLPYLAGMGFDVLYLPPIHPIGRTHRKGKNNAPTAGPNDPGSPWAIGSEEGGHKAVHPQLGTLEDFRRFRAKAEEQGLEIALDLAFQCSPDHPYVTEHPEWFRWRPDGTVQYAENPPKRYEDIYPFDFETDRWRELWEELRSVVTFWIEEGVRIFRVDNPHTKPFAFWEWLISDLTARYPDLILLSEAFTRPKVMHRLAQLGFSQSYTYFAWRNAKWELTEYFTDLTQTEVRDYFRPNLWPNTPDILTEYLQHGGKAAFVARLVLAATLGANYGIYGPAFELMEGQARDLGSEEYLHSEKYEIKRWDVERTGSLRDLITRVNRARRENPALQQDWSLRFHPVDNDRMICYSKRTDSNLVLAVVNLDPHYTQAGMVDLPLESLGLDPKEPFQMHDVLTDARYIWQGPTNYVELSPTLLPAHLFRVRRRVRKEHDFAYYR